MRHKLGMDLFRIESIETQRFQHQGRVVVKQPATMQIGAVTIALVMVATIAYLATASFDRRERVVGQIVPARGMAAAYPPPGALVKRILVHVGDKVTPGQVLAVLSSDVYGKNGSLAEEEYRQMRTQIGENANQIASTEDRASVDASRMTVQLDAARERLASLAKRRDLVARQAEVASSQVTSVEALLEKGFITKVEYERRLQAHLTILQNFEELQQQMQEARSDAAVLRTQLADVDVRRRSETSQLRSTKAGLRASLSTYEATRGATIRAPIGGTVANVNAREGETTPNAVPLAIIAPPGALVAEIFVPTRSAGFIRRGQEVRVLVDAFPYQRYGFVRGWIEQMDQSASLPPNQGTSDKAMEPAYRIVVRLADQAVRAYGRSEPLRPGMTIVGNVITDRRTVGQWLFDPLLVLRRP